MSEIRKNLNKSLLSANIYHWRTSGGAEVDIVIETNGNLYPIEVKSKTSLSGFDTSGLKAFRETYGDKVAKEIIVYAGEECYKISPDIYAIPLEWHILEFKPIHIFKKLTTNEQEFNFINL